MYRNFPAQLNGAILGLSVAFLSLTQPTEANSLSAAQLAELPFEELMQMDVMVSSVSKMDQLLADTAAGVFVITAEDLRRSGVSSIPEALRMVPGMQVARIGSSEWAVSARGFSSRYSKFQLILVDGRSVYDPLFGGVNWDEQNLILENIERIEVIRGPAGSVWGSNAVNGMVNIITRQARDSQGLYLSVAGGNELERSSLVLNYGAPLAQGHYRVGLRHARHGLMSGSEGLDDNAWQDQRITFDYQGDLAQGQLSVSFALFRIETETLWPSIQFDRFTTFAVDPEEDKEGGSFQVNWEKEIGPNVALSLRSSYDDIHRSSDLFEWNSDNFDLDAEITYSGLAKQEIRVGANTRFSRSEFINKGGFSLTITPEKDRLENLSLFVQDEIRLNRAVRLTLGARFEDSSLGGSALLPSARLLWKPAEQHRVWAAASRAEATLSRFESDNLRVNTDILPPGVAGPLPVLLTLTNSGESPENSELLAYELGYRFHQSENFEMDLTLFRHEYDHLIDSGRALPPYLSAFSGQSFTQLDLVASDTAEGELSGAELSTSWKINDQIYLQYSGSYIESDIDNGSPVFYDAPEWQHSLRALWNLKPEISLDSWLSYVDAVPESDIESYWNLNVRVAWQLSPRFRVSLMGKNLIDSDRVEFERENLPPNNHEMVNYWFIKFEWTPGN